MVKICVLGGGHGNSNILASIRGKYEDISAVVAVTDDGGSAGLLKMQRQCLPPGDIMRNMIALSYLDDRLKALLEYRLARKEFNTLNERGLITGALTTRQIFEYAAAKKRVTSQIENSSGLEDFLNKIPDEILNQEVFVVKGLNIKMGLQRAPSLEPLHPIRNLLYIAYIDYFVRTQGKREEAVVSALNKLLCHDSKVVPVSYDHVELIASIYPSNNANPALVFGEKHLDHMTKNDMIEWIGFSDKISLAKKAEKAIKNADVLIISPGSFYTSILPVLFVPGVREAMKDKQIIFVSNIFSTNETNYPVLGHDGNELKYYTADDFIQILSWNDIPITDVLANEFNVAEVPGRVFSRYIKEDKSPVELPVERYNGINVYTRKMACVIPGTRYIAHDPEITSAALREIIGC